MESYAGNKPGDMSPEIKDYQAPKSNCAGEMMGKTNDYIGRHEKTVAKEAGKIRSQAHKGRYD